MATASNLTMLAGGIAFAGNFKESGGFPENGYTIIAATATLTVIFAMTNRTAFAQPTAALAGLMVLAAVYRYVPAFTKGKKS